MDDDNFWECDSYGDSAIVVSDNIQLDKHSISMLCQRLARGILHELRAALLEMKWRLESFEELVSASQAFSNLTLHEFEKVKVRRSGQKLTIVQRGRGEQMIRVRLSLPKHEHRSLPLQRTQIPSGRPFKLLRLPQLVEVIRSIAEAVGMKPDQLEEDEELLRNKDSEEDTEWKREAEEDAENLLEFSERLFEIVNKGLGFGFDAFFSEITEDSVYVFVEKKPAETTQSGPEGIMRDSERQNEELLQITCGQLEQERGLNSYFLMPFESIVTFKRQAYAVSELKKCQQDIDRRELVIRRIITDTHVSEEYSLARSLAETPNKVLEDACFLDIAGQLQQASLSEEQKHMLQNAWARSLTVVRGPPGSGKTHMIAQFVRVVSLSLFGDRATYTEGLLKGFRIPFRVGCKSLMTWNAQDVAIFAKGVKEFVAQNPDKAAMSYLLELPSILRGKSGSFIQSLCSKESKRYLESWLTDMRSVQPSEEELCNLFRELEEIRRLCEQQAGRTRPAKDLKEPKKMLLTAATNQAVWNMLRAVEKTGVPQEQMLLHCSKFVINAVPLDLQRYTLDGKFNSHHLNTKFLTVLDAIAPKSFEACPVIDLKDGHKLTQAEEALKHSLEIYEERNGAPSWQRDKASELGKHLKEGLTSLGHLLGLPKIEEFNKQLKWMENLIREFIRDAECQIVFGTASSFASGLKESKFCMAVMDESFQICEPEAFIPLMKGAQWVFMIGDEKQLRPCVKTRQARRSW
mmetsp:Transcript_39011/g.92412  ORF Transcript_39011/g.92412 Transcript_39011/m.92412 type:complete len:746 (-) Transcript_39011:1084-3321(-)